MSEAGSAPERSPEVAGRRLTGLALLVSGIMLTAGSSLCTGLFVINSMSGEASGPDIIAIELGFGWPFILLGMLMWWGGLRLRRGRTEDSRGDGSV